MPQTPDERTRPLSEYPAPLRRVVIALAVVTLAGWSFAVLSQDSADYHRLLSTPGVWILVVLMVFADLYPGVPWLRDVRGHVLIHWSAAIALALLLTYGPVVIVLFPLLGFTAVVGHGGAWWRVGVNVGVMVIEGLLAGVVVEAAGGGLEQGGWSVWTLMVLGVLLAVLWDLVNVLSVVTVVWLAGGHPSWWRGVLAGFRTTVFWFGGLLLAPLIAAVAVTAPQLLLLLLVIEVAVHHNMAAVVRVARQARTDPLTGLANRRAATELLDQITGSGEPAQAAVMLIDLDGFKRVNDTWGHAVGDEVLTAVAQRLRAVVPADRLVARLGGDEFVVIGGEPDELPALVATLRQQVSVPIGVSGEVVSIGFTCGWDVAHRGADPLAVIRGADRALYRAKQDRDAGREPALDQPLRPSEDQQADQTRRSDQPIGGA